MSVTDRNQRRVEGEFGDLPEFELGYLVDDEEHPTTVTVFPESTDRNISTHWIAVDAKNAVPLEAVR